MFESFKWFLALASVTGVVLNIRKNRACFFIWAATNASWCVVDLVHAVWAQAALQSVYFGLAIWGIRSWKKS